MKRAYAVSQYGKCYEQYCKEYLPQQAKDIFDKAEQYYKEFVKNDMPDLRNILDVTFQRTLDIFLRFSDFQRIASGRVKYAVRNGRKPCQLYVWG